MTLYVTILAGGLGKRMQSNIPKVLHQVKGEAMIVRLIKQILFLEPSKILIVVGKYREIIQTEIEKQINDTRIHYVNQENALGTGDAVKCTLSHFDNDGITNIILNGDVPLLRYQTISEIYQSYLSQKSKLLITSINLSNPTGNGRIVIDNTNNFSEIIEEKDCTDLQKQITLVNCGIYVCDSSVLRNLVPKITNKNAQNEYYLTDLVKLFKDQAYGNVQLFVLSKEREIEIYNVNTKEQLQYIEQQLN